MNSILRSAAILIFAVHSTSAPTAKSQLQSPKQNAYIQAASKIASQGPPPVTIQTKTQSKTPILEFSQGVKASRAKYSAAQPAQVQSVVSELPNAGQGFGTAQEPVSSAVSGQDSGALSRQNFNAFQPIANTISVADGIANEVVEDVIHRLKRDLASGEVIEKVVHAVVEAFDGVECSEHESDCHDSDSHESDCHESDSHDSDCHESDWHESDCHDSDSHESDCHDSDSHESDCHESDWHESDCHESDWHESDCHDSDSHESDCHDSDSHDSDCHDSDCHDSDSHDSDCHDSDSHDSDCHDSDSHESDCHESDSHESDCHESDDSDEWCSHWEGYYTQAGIYHKI